MYSPKACQKIGPASERSVARAAPGASDFIASPSGVSENRCPSGSVFRMPRPASSRISRWSADASVPVSFASSAALRGPPASLSARPSFAAA